MTSVITDTNKEASSSSLTGSIFGENKKGGLFDTSVSSRLPERPNIVDPERFAPKRKPTAEQKQHQQQPKIVVGGKKRMREKRRLEEQKQQQEQQQRTDDTENPTRTPRVVAEKDDGDADTDKNDGPSSKTDNDDKKEDDNVDDRTVFVGNLPVEITRKGLAAIFKDCGNIESTRLRSVATTGVKLPEGSKGNQNLVKKVCANTRKVDNTARRTSQGYVVFRSRSSVAAALALNGTDFDGRRLRVDTCKPTVDVARSVFVGNLPYGTDESELSRHFEESCGEGSVEGVRVVRDPETSRCKGFGYVLLARREFVGPALRANGSVFANREIRVLPCGKRCKGRRGVAENDDAGKKRNSFEGTRSARAAAKRIASSSPSAASANKKIRLVPVERKRGKGTNRRGTTPGVSRRAATESKLNKREKKLRKRAERGMGKTKTR